MSNDRNTETVAGFERDRLVNVDNYFVFTDVFLQYFFSITIECIILF